LHYDNILLNGGGDYKIIDPLGFIGDPIFETGRYMSYEYWNDKSESRCKIFDNIIKMTEYFEKSLHVPNEILRRCFFIDTVADKCCRVEGGDTADLVNIKFAESVMNQ
jgi:streptomycin 6-kinase